MKEQQERIKQLVQLISENPTLEILPMVDSDCVPSDDFSYWCANWGEAEIDEYYISDERIYFKSIGYEELVDKTDQETQEAAEYIVNNFEWIKAIVVHIETK